MKRWTCLILAVLMLFCSCSRTAGTDKTSETTFKTEQQTAMDTYETVAVSETVADNIEESPPTIRYEKKYKLQPITDTLLGMYADKIYLHNGLLYYLTSDYQMQEDTLYAVICMYDSEGNLTEMKRLAVSEDMGKSMPHRVFMLSDGRYLMFHVDNAYLGKEDGVFRLLDASGTVLYSHEVQEITALSSAPIRVYEDDSGGFSVWYHADGRFIMLDETLTQQKCISTGVGCLEFLRMDDTYFLLMFDSSESYRANVQLGYSNIYGLHLPKSFDYRPVFCGANEALYISNQSGVYRYEQGRQPEQILSWFELDLTDLDVNDSAAYNLWVMDDTHLYLSYREKRDGRVSDVIYLITVEEVPVSKEKTELVLECISTESLGWLESIIRNFNISNSEYSIKLNYVDSRMSKEAQDAHLQNRLLSSSPPDIWISIGSSNQSKYYDKNAFIDLMPLLGDRVLSGVLNAYTWNGALYTIPVGMWVKTLVSIDTVCDSMLTWEKLYDITESLSDGDFLATDLIAEDLFYASIMDFVDFEARSSSFDSLAYQQLTEYLQTMNMYCAEDLVSISTGGMTLTEEWNISHGNLIPYIRNGSVKLLDITFKNIQAYAALKLVYGDTPFTLCGYPTNSGKGNGEMYGFYSVSVFRSTKYPDGCKAFLETLFSVEAQTTPSLIEEYLPVTRDSLEVLIDRARYQYYTNMMIHSIEKFESGPLPLEWEGISTDYLDNFGIQKNTANGYTVREYTEKDKQDILSFFDHCSFSSEADDKIREIVVEELSYYTGNARSLEETTKIIDSRVWIYLNE